MLIEDAADGEVNFTALRGEFERAPGAIEPVRRSMRNLEPAVEDVADELHNAGRGMSDIASTAPAVVNGIDQVGARSRDMTPYVGALATNMGTAATNTANFSDKLGTTQSNLLALVEGSPWTVRVNVTSGGYPEYARGGEVTAPGVALVGERGPELVSLPAGARVYSAGETRERLGTTVGPIYVNVSAGPISNAIDVRELADVVSLELAERIKMRL